VEVVLIPHGKMHVSRQILFILSIVVSKEVLLEIEPAVLETFQGCDYVIRFGFEKNCDEVK
jgi:hypothetical protein